MRVAGTGADKGPERAVEAAGAVPAVLLEVRKPGVVGRRHPPHVSQGAAVPCLLQCSFGNRLLSHPSPRQQHSKPL